MMAGRTMMGRFRYPEDLVAGGDERHDAYLRGDSAGDEHDADEDGIAQGALLAALRLVVLTEARNAREGEADDRAQHRDEDDD